MLVLIAGVKKWENIGIMNRTQNPKRNQKVPMHVAVPQCQILVYSIIDY